MRTEPARDQARGLTYFNERSKAMLHVQTVHGRNCNCHVCQLDSKRAGEPVRVPIRHVVHPITGVLINVPAPNRSER